MILDIVFLIAGLVAVTVGANWLTDGSSAVAKRFGVSEFMIGMTIVAVGTSLPELVVSITAALAGSSDISVGNIVGSNICNIFLILGLTSLIVPIPLTKENIRKDVPLTLILSLFFAFISLDALYRNSENVISRPEGIILFVLYILFIIYLSKTSKQQTESSENIQQAGIWKTAVLVIVGLAALIGGAKIFVKGAIGIAKAMDISEAVIGITIVAVGTSLPELAASLVAAIKGKSAMAIGNILGSNIANILLIIGTSATISPLHLNDIDIDDFAVMILAPLLMLLFPIIFRWTKITRTQGAVFLALYIAYTISLLV